MLQCGTVSLKVLLRLLIPAVLVSLSTAQSCYERIMFVYLVIRSIKSGKIVNTPDVTNAKNYDTVVDAPEGCQATRQVVESAYISSL